MPMIRWEESAIGVSTNTIAAAWTRERFDAEVAKVATAIGRAVAEPASRLDYVLELILAPEALANREEHLSLVALAVTALRLHAQYGGLSDVQLGRIVELTKSVLMLHGLKPSSPRGAFLHAELHLAVALARSQNGCAWEALFSLGRAQVYERRDEPNIKTALLAAEQALRLGLPVVVMAQLEAAQTGAQDVDDGALIAVLKAGAHRLSADHEAAHASLRALAAFPLPPEKVIRAAAWERLWLETMLPERARDAARALKRDHENLLAARAVDLWVWARCLKVHDAAALFPNLRDAKAKAAKHSTSPLDPSFLKAAQLIERCYDAEATLDARVEAAGLAMAATAAIGSFERQYLIAAAVGRWLLRYNQLSLAAAVVAEIRRRGDLLNIFRDDDPARLVARSELGSRPGGPPDARRGFGEIFEMARILSAALGLVVKGTLKKWASSDAEAGRRIALDNDVAVAKLVATYLGRRKGILLKIGQICAYVEGPIAQHLMSEFEMLHADVEPMPAADVRRVVTEALGRAPEAIFPVFDVKPFAAGSIGQVHRARTRDGFDVAVKVQYPEARRMIEVDLRRAPWIKRFFSKRLPSADLDGLIAEVTRHVLAETDYEQERRNIEEFRRTFADDARIVIPRAHPELSSARVLTMDYVEGLSLSAFTQTATQAERNAAGTAIMSFFCRGIGSLGVFHADPHPGNFRFLPDGRVAVLDFGCVKRFSAEFLARRNAMMRAFFRQDWEAFAAGYVDLGLARRREDFDLDAVVKSFRVLFAHSLHDEPYRFASDAPGAVYRAFVTESQNRERLVLPADFLLAMRFDFGLASILAQLGAEAAWRAITLPPLFGTEALPPPFPATEGQAA